MKKLKLDLDLMQGKLGRQEMKSLKGGGISCNATCEYDNQQGYCLLQNSGQFGAGCYCVVTGVGWFQRFLCPPSGA